MHLSRILSNVIIYTETKDKFILLISLVLATSGLNNWSDIVGKVLPYCGNVSI